MVCRNKQLKISPCENFATSHKCQAYGMFVSSDWVGKRRLWVAFRTTPTTSPPSPSPLPPSRRKREDYSGWYKDQSCDASLSIPDCTRHTSYTTMCQTTSGKRSSRLSPPFPIPGRHFVSLRTRDSSMDIRYCPVMGKLSILTDEERSADNFADSGLSPSAPIHDDGNQKHKCFVCARFQEEEAAESPYSKSHLLKSLPAVLRYSRFVFHSACWSHTLLINMVWTIAQ